MTAPQVPKSTPRARWLSTSHGRACPDIRLSSQIVRQFAASNVARRSFINRLTIGQPTGPARPQSHISSTALKSP